MLPTAALLAMLLAEPPVSVPAVASSQPAPLPDADALYARIRARYRPMYEKYQGVEDRSRVETRIYNSRTQQLKESRQLETLGRTYFYRKPERTVLRYQKDGVELDPAEADGSQRGDPMIPIWDGDGPTHYRVQVLGREPQRGQPCYRLQIEPRQKTARHFAGQVWVNAESLDLVAMEGRMADVPFGVEEVRFRVEFRQAGEVAVHERFEMEAAADIPLLYPDTRVVSTSRVLTSTPIPR